jgi:hypothetical protein
MFTVGWIKKITPKYIMNVEQCKNYNWTMIWRLQASWQFCSQYIIYNIGCLGRSAAILKVRQRESGEAFHLDLRRQLPNDTVIV